MSSVPGALEKDLTYFLYHRMAKLKGTLRLLTRFLTRALGELW